MPKIHLCEDGRWFGTATLLRHADGTVSILDRPDLPEVETLDEEPEPYTPEEVYAAIERAVADGRTEVVVGGGVYTWRIDEDDGPAPGWYGTDYATYYVTPSGRVWLVQHDMVDRLPQEEEELNPEARPIDDLISVEDLDLLRGVDLR